MKGMPGKPSQPLDNYRMYGRPLKSLNADQARHCIAILIDREQRQRIATQRERETLRQIRDARK